MAEQMKILIVDDDEHISELISLYLAKEGYDCHMVYDGESAIREQAAYQPDLILLDIMLPGMDGYEVCSEIRKSSNIPIIMLSAKGESFDKVHGLKMGADDYLAKPFDTKELLARIAAVLRRSGNRAASPADARQTGEFVSYQNLTVNITTYSVTYHGKILEMPPKELELLYFLASSPNQVFTREQLLNRIWGYDYIGDSRTVDVHVKRLREKFTEAGDNWSIATVWGVGYKFDLH